MQKIFQVRRKKIKILSGASFLRNHFDQVRI
jgi:hypothetical protein